MKSDVVLKGFYYDDVLAFNLAVQSENIFSGLDYNGIIFDIPWGELSKEKRQVLLSKSDYFTNKNTIKENDVCYLKLYNLQNVYKKLEINDSKVIKILSQSNKEKAVLDFIHYYIDAWVKYDELKKTDVSRTKGDDTVVNIQYYLSSELIKQQVLKTGEHISSTRHYHIPLAKLPNDIRYEIFRRESTCSNFYSFFLQNIELDNEIKDDDELIEIMRNYIKKDSKVDKHESDKKTWIEHYGSAHLKRAFKMGYHCQREYIIQRANREFPSFELDFDNKYTLQERPMPSEKALVEEESIHRTDSLETRIVWLKKEKKEALTIQNYLERYRLIKIIN